MTGYKGTLALFIDKRETWACTDRGIDWVTDRYVLLRADLLRSAPKNSQLLPNKALRKLLDAVRSAPALGVASDTGARIPTGWRDQNESAVVGMPGGPIVAVNPSAWAAWLKTGLEPRMDGRGIITWHGLVRGRPALFGALQPIRIHGKPRRLVVASAEDDEE